MSVVHLIDDDAEKDLAMLVSALTQIKLFHWAARDFSKHKTLDELHDDLVEGVDALLCVCVWGGRQAGRGQAEWQGGLQRTACTHHPHPPQARLVLYLGDDAQRGPRGLPDGAHHGGGAHEGREDEVGAQRPRSRQVAHVLRAPAASQGGREGAT